MYSDTYLHLCINYLSIKQVTRFWSVITSGAPQILAQVAQFLISAIFNFSASCEFVQLFKIYACRNCTYEHVFKFAHIQV